MARPRLASLVPAAALAGAVLVLTTAPALAVPVCDVSTPSNCLKPGADGSLPPGPLAPKGYQQITSLSSSTALTVPTGATGAVIIPESQAVRWRDDGVAPTATVGMPLSAGQPMTVRGAAALAAIRFIEQAASAKLSVSYYQ